MYYVTALYVCPSVLIYSCILMFSECLLQNLNGMEPAINISHIRRICRSRAHSVQVKGNHHNMQKTKFLCSVNRLKQI